VKKKMGDEKEVNESFSVFFFAKQVATHTPPAAL
jgi:hypothetical protein